MLDVVSQVGYAIPLAGPDSGAKAGSRHPPSKNTFNYQNHFLVGSLSFPYKAL